MQKSFLGERKTELHLACHLLHLTGYLDIPLLLQGMDMEGSQRVGEPPVSIIDCPFFEGKSERPNLRGKLFRFHKNERRPSCYIVHACFLCTE